MKKRFSLIVLAASMSLAILPNYTMADSAKPVMNCRENNFLGQNAYYLRTLQVLDNGNGTYSYSASITPSDQSGNAIGPSSYASDGVATVINGSFEDGGFKANNGSVSVDYIGCGHVYMFEDQGQEIYMHFGVAACQFN
jgi:hypothetical protein